MRLLGISLVLVASAATAQWTVESFSYGFLPAMQADEAGSHVAFYDGNQLAYGLRTAEGWTVEPVDPAGSTGQWCSITLASTGNPGIAYDHQRSAYFAEKVGGTWTVEAIAAVGNPRRMAVGYLPGDVPTVAFHDWDGPRSLKYATRTGDGWSIETVDASAKVGEGADLAVGSDGLPRIAYYDETNQKVKLATRDGASWVIETVDDCLRGGWDYFIALELDAADEPVLAYLNRHRGVDVARHDGAAWGFQRAVVDTADYLDMKLDAEGDAHIGLGRPESFPWVAPGKAPVALGTLHLDDGLAGYLYESGGVWQLEEVGDDFGDTGVAIALDPTTGDARVTYEGSASNGDMRYGWRAPPAGGLEVTVVDHPDVVSPGGVLEFTAEVTNTGANPESFDEGALSVTGPVSRDLPLYGGSPVELPGGATLSRDVDLPVPEGTPSGSYVADVQILSGGDLLDSDAFDVDVE